MATRRLVDAIVFALVSAVACAAHGAVSLNGPAVAVYSSSGSNPDVYINATGTGFGTAATGSQVIVETSSGGLVWSATYGDPNILIWRPNQITVKAPSSVLSGGTHLRIVAVVTPLVINKDPNRSCSTCFHRVPYGLSSARVGIAKYTFTIYPLLPEGGDPIDLAADANGRVWVLGQFHSANGVALQYFDPGSGSVVSPNTMPLISPSSEAPFPNELTGSGQTNYRH